MQSGQQNLTSTEAVSEFRIFKQKMMFEIMTSRNYGPLTIRDAFTHVDSTIQVGDSLYEIIFMCYLAESLRHANLNDKGNAKVKVYAEFIHKWLAWQVEHFDNEEINEFHQSFTRSGNNYFIHKAFEYLSRELAESTSLGFDYDIDQIIAFTNNYHQLQKLISSEDINRYGKKNGTLKNTLATVKFEILLNATILHTKNKNYILAEALANKAFENLSAICTTERSYMCSCLAINLAYIKLQQNDHASTIDYVNEFIKINNQGKVKLTQYPGHDLFIVKCFEFMADYYVNLGKVDIAIKYLLTAIDFVFDFLEKNRLKNIMQGLIPKLTSLIATVAGSEPYKTILAEVKSYPGYGLIYLYFDNSQCAKEVELQLTKNEVTVKHLKNPGEKQGFAIECAFDFDLEKFIQILDRAKLRLAKNLRVEKAQNNNNGKMIKKVDNSAAESSTSYISHPKAVSKKTNKKKNKNAEKLAEKPIKSKPRWQFLEFMQPAPLQVVKFKNYIFDPQNPTGVVTLRVNNMSGKWYAIINPDLANELVDNEELQKIMQRFQTEIELGHDYCVPCAKEMRLKEKELGRELPYLFKIRLMGKGNGDVRIYAKIIDDSVPGKTLVAFTAINFKAHSKDSRPVEIELKSIASSRQLSC